MIKTKNIFKILPLAFSLLIISCNTERSDDKRVLFILTSHAEKGNTGEKTGFYLSEAAHPWKVLTSNGISVDFVSIKGGMPPVDGFKLDDPVNREFWENPEVQKALKNTQTPGEVDPNQYHAVHFVGGHGTMWDFPENKDIALIAASVYENSGYISAVCHGPAGLLNIRLSDGTYLIDGKTVTSFTNAEEAAAGLTEVVPFLLEDALVKRGANFVGDENWSDHVQVSGRLITGQNPQSATSVGNELVRAINK